MKWTTVVRSEFARRHQTVDETIVEEMAQHADAAWQQARAEGHGEREAEATVLALVRSWCSQTSGPRRLERTPLVEAAPAGRSPFSGLGLDLRQAFRLLRRQPGVACLSALMIALGIGVTSTLFTVVNSVLLRPLPWKTADRLVRVWENRTGMSAETEEANGLTNVTYNAWGDAAQTIDGLAGWNEGVLSLAGNASVERIRTASVTTTLFPLLGESPLLGVNFTAEDARAATTTVILSYGFWQERFGGARDIIGKQIAFDGRSRTIVAVMPRGFEFPTSETRVWVPFELGPAYTSHGPDRRYHINRFNGIARLKPGVTPAQATAEGSARLSAVKLDDYVMPEVFKAKGGASITAVPLLDWMIRDVKPALWILLAAGGLLFIAAIGTVVNLQLAQATARRREVAIRSAIGAGAGRLARQLLVETMALSAIGGMLGLGLTVLLLRALPSLLPSGFPRVDHVGIDARVFGVVAVLSLVVSLAIGLLPSRMARRLRLTSALAEDGSAPIGHGVQTSGARARGLIITGQVAIAAVLLVGGVLLSRSFTALVAADRGYEPSNLLTARIGFLGAGLPAGSRAAFYKDVLERLTARPGVTHAAFTSSLPTASPNWKIPVRLRPGDGKDDGTEVETVYRLMSDDYFATMGIRILSGRGFTAEDTMTSEPVVVVNQTFARRYLAGNAIGVEVSPDLYQYRREVHRWRIVGVVADVQHDTPVDPIHPELYATTGQLTGYPAQFLTVRTQSHPAALTADVRTIVRAVSRNASLDQLMTMEGRLRTSLARPRLYAALIDGFSAFALLIAVIGLFGGLSYAVTQRTREIGVRTALGATPLDIITLVMRQGTVMTLAGLALGLGLAAATGRYLTAFLFGVQPFDPATFVVVGAALMVVALVACAIPARRAARIDAIEALRH
jgi:putative ABC transport system permease protein